MLQHVYVLYMPFFDLFCIFVLQTEGCRSIVAVLLHSWLDLPRMYMYIILFENLECQTWAQMFSAKVQIDRFQGSSFFPTQTIVIISWKMVYLSPNHLSSCIFPVKYSASVSRRLTNLQPPCSSVESCVGDGCDEDSPMFWLWHIWSARDVEIGELWIYTF